MWMQREKKIVAYLKSKDICFYLSVRVLKTEREQSRTQPPAEYVWGGGC